MRFSTDFGHYELSPFPGSNQIVISTHAFVKKEHRGNGHGKEMAQTRITQARDLGYDYMLCTVRADNEPQLKIMRALGWKQLDKFTSSVSEVDIYLFGLPL